jgi:hypothetical protein
MRTLYFALIACVFFINNFMTVNISLFISAQISEECNYGIRLDGILPEYKKNPVMNKKRTL